jgi:pilus assembly protein CpaC
MKSRRTASALLAVVGAWATLPAALAQDPSTERAQGEDAQQKSVLRVPANGNFPLSMRRTLGQGKSLLVQFPFELKDVLVADPEKVDAVVQSSNRVFLIAKVQGKPTPSSSIPKGQRDSTAGDNRRCRPRDTR